MPLLPTDRFQPSLKTLAVFTLAEIRHFQMWILIKTYLISGRLNTHANPLWTARATHTDSGLMPVCCILLKELYTVCGNGTTFRSW